MAFTLDWSTSNLSGDNALTDGGDSLTANISRGGDGTGSQDGTFVVGSVGGMPAGTLISDLVNEGGNDTPEVVVDFTDGAGTDVEVENISLSLIHI